MHGDGDGWVWCAHGHKHWGRHGAAGLLLRRRDEIMLQHRAAWSHHGDTWGLPGGARDSHESAVHAALREAAEEAGVDPTAVRPTGLYEDDHGGWAYTTVLAGPVRPVDGRSTGGESIEVRWHRVADVERLPLHPGFAVTWPPLRDAGQPPHLVVDGANVVGSRPDGWWSDRPGAARRLRVALEALVDAGIATGDLPAGPPAGPLHRVFPRVTLVVEGKAAVVAEDPPPSAADAVDAVDAVEVVAASGSGDDAIVAVAARLSGTEPVVVVTADRVLGARVREHAGVAVVGPRWLLDLSGG